MLAKLFLVPFLSFFSVNAATEKGPLDTLAPSQPEHFVYIQSALHGNEQETTDFTRWLAERIRKGRGPLAALQVSHRIGYDFLYVANPKGFELNQRWNGNGVNLNRNFAKFWEVTQTQRKGAFAFSEPETSKIQSLIDKKDYILAVDVHGFVPMIVLPSYKEIVSNTKLRSWRSRIESIEWPKKDSYQFVSALDLEHGGAFEDWVFWTKGTYSLCLELENRQIELTEFMHYEQFLAQAIMASLPKQTFAEVRL